MARHRSHSIEFKRQVAHSNTDAIFPRRCQPEDGDPRRAALESDGDHRRPRYRQDHPGQFHPAHPRREKSHSFVRANRTRSKTHDGTTGYQAKAIHRLLVSMAETKCAKGRRESVPVGLREKGCEARFIFVLPCRFIFRWRGLLRFAFSGFGFAPEPIAAVPSCWRRADSFGVLGEAFELRSSEKFLSATWLEYFAGPHVPKIKASVRAIRASKLKPGGKSGFAIALQRPHESSDGSLAP
jgi:hypothetical protein